MLSVAFQYLKRDYNLEGDSVRMTKNCFELKLGRFRLDVRRIFFTQKEMRRLTRVVVEVFEDELDMTLGSLIWCLI